VTGRRRRRFKQLVDDLGEKRGYWKTKEGEINCTQWGTRFGGGNGPVAEIDCRINKCPASSDVSLTFM
jgi:hypothetical protein